MTIRQRAGEDLLYRPLTPAPVGAVQVLDHQALAIDDVEIDRLMRPVQQPGIMPRQPAKIGGADTQLLGRSANISTMLRQDFRDAHEIETSATRRELRNERHRPSPSRGPPAQIRLEPEMDEAFKLSLERRDPERGPPARAGRLATPQHAASPETDPAHEPVVVQAQRLRLPAAARGDEEAPAAAVRELHEGEADFDRAAGEGDHSRRHVSGDGARGAKPRSGNDRKVVLKDTHGSLDKSEHGANANGVGITLLWTLIMFPHGEAE